MTFKFSKMALFRLKEIEFLRLNFRMIKMVNLLVLMKTRFCLKNEYFKQICWSQLHLIADLDLLTRLAL